MDNDDPGYHHLTEEEIASTVLEKEEEEEESEPPEAAEAPFKLSHIRRSMDDIMLWLDYVNDPESQWYYSMFREFRLLVIRRQLASHKQVKIHDFFTPMPNRALHMQGE